MIIFIIYINVLCDFVMYNFTNCIFCVFDILEPFSIMEVVCKIEFIIPHKAKYIIQYNLNKRWN